MFHVEHECAWCQSKSSLGMIVWGLVSDPSRARRGQRARLIKLIRKLSWLGPFCLKDDVFHVEHSVTGDHRINCGTVTSNLTNCYR